MAIQNSTLRNRTPSWNSKKRYKVNESVYYNGIVWQNITGSNSEPGAGFDWLNVNGGGSGGATSNLLKEQFEFVASQTFTLANNYAQVYAVMVSGQGSLHTSQYDLIAPNQVEILDTLEAGDFVIVLYASEAVGVQPYYTQAQIDAFLASFIPLTGTTNPITGDLEFQSGLERKIYNSNGYLAFTADGNLKTVFGSGEVQLSDSISYIRGLAGGLYLTPDGIMVVDERDNPSGLVGESDFSANYGDTSYVQKRYVKPHGGVGTDLPIDKIGGYFGDMTTANASILYNLVGDLVVGVFGMVLINAPTQPTIEGNLHAAGSFVLGKQYKIKTLGTTDFTLIGASANTVGVVFTATNVGTGTGEANINTVLIDGADFLPNTDMHLCYQYLGGINVQYYFLRL